jgi:catechol 2,3-dioxygenase-like lactoylglutathione lyase family enzyme
MRLRFDCVFYYVRDMERAISFYTRVLGLKLVSQDLVARFDIDGVLFELAPAPDEAALEGNGNARLCLGVDNIEQAVAELQARGVPTRDVQDVGNGLLAFFRDPEGNEICLWQAC